MGKLSNKAVYDSVKKMTLNVDDIIIINVKSYAESEKELEGLGDSIQELCEVLKNTGVTNSILVLGPDADINTLNEEMLSELGYYKKNIPSENIDKYYD